MSIYTYFLSGFFYQRRGEESMDFLKGKIKEIYFKYLMAAFGSALITSIYSIFDMAMVGQYYGPQGTAALAVVAPVWNIVYSMGLLMGIGGSVLFSITRGRGGKDRQSNEYFTVSVIGSILLVIVIWPVIIYFDRELLQIFGAEGTTLNLAREYIKPIKAAVPFFLFNQMLAAYLRNDKNPGLATAAILSGGIFNILGDYFFVFLCDFGAFGAGIATAIGAAISFIMMVTHFFSTQNTLRLVKPEQILRKIKEITVTGFSTFFVDVAMGILTILFNRQIMKYLGTNALAVYGVIVNVSTFVQCCAYSVGQASQPIISTNYGAGKGERVKETLKYALGTVAFFGILWSVLCIIFPHQFVRIFMEPTREVVAITPGIIRKYSSSFLLLPLNIFSTYYFQALIKPKEAFVVAVARGLIVSGVLIVLLPVVFSGDAVWYAMPVTEMLVSIYAIYKIMKYTERYTTKQS